MEPPRRAIGLSGRVRQSLLLVFARFVAQIAFSRSAAAVSVAISRARDHGMSGRDLEAVCNLPPGGLKRIERLAKELDEAGLAHMLERAGCQLRFASSNTTHETTLGPLPTLAHLTSPKKAA